MEHGGGGTGGEHGSLLHFLNGIGEHYGIHDLQIAGMSWIVIILLVGLSYLATRRMSRRNPSSLQNAMEMVVDALDGFVREAIGPHAEKFTPLIGTMFLYILTMNLLGLIPGLLSPTANLNTTAALGISAFLLVQYFGVRAVGLKNYLMHFVGEPVWLAPLNIPIHVIGELARPLSLSFRLFGNIFGEDMVIVILAGLAASVLPIYLPIPLQFPMLLFAIFTSFVQALVFTMLTSAYIAGAITHEEH